MNSALIASLAILIVGPSVCRGQADRRLAVATFAGGCFWAVQDVFDKVPGVVETTAGYMGGTTPNPTYEQVRKGGTGHVEAVQVKYDPAKVSYEQLLGVYWNQAMLDTSIRELESPTRRHVPTLFTHTEHDYTKACESLMQTKREGKHPILTAQATVLRAKEFYADPDPKNQHYYQKQKRQ